MNSDVKIGEIVGDKICVGYTEDGVPEFEANTAGMRRLLRSAHWEIDIGKSTRRNYKKKRR